MDVTPALRDTSDDLVANLERLHAMELEKRATEVGSPRFVELAKEVERLAAEVLEASTQQKDLARESAVEAASGAAEATETTIDETPPASERDDADAVDPIADDVPRDIHEILADWRDAERDRATASPGSAEARRLAERIADLRREYRAAIDALEA